MAIGKGKLIWGTDRNRKDLPRFKSQIIITSFKPSFRGRASEHDGQIKYYLGSKNKKRKGGQYHGDKRTGIVDLSGSNYGKRKNIRFVNRDNKIIIYEWDYDWDYEYEILIDDDKKYNEIKTHILSKATKSKKMKVTGSKKLKPITKQKTTTKKKTTKRKAPAKKKTTKRKTTKRKR